MRLGFTYLCDLTHVKMFVITIIIWWYSCMGLTYRGIIWAPLWDFQIPYGNIVTWASGKSIQYLYFANGWRPLCSIKVLCSHNRKLEFIQNLWGSRPGSMSDREHICWVSLKRHYKSMCSQLQYVLPCGIIWGPMWDINPMKGTSSYCQDLASRRLLKTPKGHSYGTRETVGWHCG